MTHPFCVLPRQMMQDTQLRRYVFMQPGADAEMVVRQAAAWLRCAHVSAYRRHGFLQYHFRD